jgi:hypothetical protein
LGIRIAPPFLDLRNSYPNLSFFSQTPPAPVVDLLHQFSGSIKNLLNWSTPPIIHQLVLGRPHGYFLTPLMSLLHADLVGDFTMFASLFSRIFSISQ